MNEPKKRGRPPKSRGEQIAEEAVAKALPSLGAEIEAAVLASMAASNAAAQAYAERVWAGQSVDVPRKERLERVRKALEGQGLSMDGVTL